MGMLDLLFKSVFGSGSKTAIGPGMALECQQCKAKIDSGMKRCPSCGVHLSSMFQLKCPSCGETSGWEAQKCKKCRADFFSQSLKEGKSSYKCPMCGYAADYYMVSCPSCGVKFI
ncbi:hypothetical protein FJZ26_03690 [Candidatus Parvarchaeota archaeon]|nr:hypothetical protein [Candidatus Parvarchaeota archaeon]